VKYEILLVDDTTYTVVKSEITVFTLRDKMIDRHESLSDNVCLPLLWRYIGSNDCGQWGAWISTGAIGFPFFFIYYLPVTVRSNPLLFPMSVLSIEISTTTTIMSHYKMT